MSDRFEREARVWDRQGFPEVGEMLRGMVPAVKRMGAPREFPSDDADRTSSKVRVATPEAPKIDLRQQTLDLLPLVVEPLAEEKEALRAKRGLVFLPMTSQSYAQVVAENPEHFWNGEFDYANDRPALRDYVLPVAAEVGFIEAELALPNSSRKPRAAALQMIEDYSQQLQAEFPDFRAVMLPATGYASADRAYAERNPVQVLFKNCFAWCLDDLSGVRAADAGRPAPSGRFGVDGWDARFGLDSVRAVPAVVKIGAQ